MCSGGCWNFAAELGSDITNRDLSMVLFSVSFRGSFSAASTPIFATKSVLLRVCQALRVYVCIIPECCHRSRRLHYFRNIERIFAKFIE